MDFYMIGLMSGTSLDGLDIAYCKFTKLESKWSYQILACKTYNYSPTWKAKLASIENQCALEFIKLDTELGKYFGKKTNEFISEFKIDKSLITAVASHGHTIFHQPHLGFSTQIGNGAQICATTQLKTINDFRSLDVALGGEGAPLVPIGDELLFGEYDYCLNLGGIANISSNENGIRNAKDITFTNMIGNYICEDLGLQYDKGGQLAKEGNTDAELLRFLNELTDVKNLLNKSLGKEIFTKEIKPYLANLTSKKEDQLHTLGVHIGFKIKEITTPNSSLLITGGGALNHFWVEQIKIQSRTNITIPAKEIIDFKEALIFAFLGVLRIEGKPNSLKSVTKASKNNIGGSVYIY